MTKPRIVTLGEVLLRLKPPGFERLLQSPAFEATFGGGEANVSISLAILGLDTAFVTVLPANPIADACIRFLKGYGVDTSLILRQGDRMGIYYFEAGANQRSSQVIYDRDHSAIAVATPQDFDWDGVLDGANWFHFTGITPALSQRAADIAISAVQAARRRAVTISCDNSYRRKLWQYGRGVTEVMGDLVRHVDVLFANEQDCALTFGVRLTDEEQRAAGDANGRHEAVARKMFRTYPNLKIQAFTLREGQSASQNRWSACLYNGKSLLTSPRYDISSIVERVGTGDAFCAGLIYGLSTGMSEQSALNFAVAASCLKHSIPGDVNRVTLSEIERFLADGAPGRVQR
jgi:2-dehydro-3-deoxygluconokinase